MLVAFLLVTSTISAQIKTEKEMVEAVFKTIQNNDLKTFISYGATDERLLSMVEGMAETTPMEKDIKKDLKTEKASSFSTECISKFELLNKELTTNNHVIKEGVLSEDIFTDLQFEITNLKCSEIKFQVTFNETVYEIEINTFNTGKDIFIYDFQYRIFN